MPFKSEAQRKYLWANEPKIARDWTDTYGSKIHKADGGRIGLARGSDRHGGTGGGPGPGGHSTDRGGSLGDRGATGPGVGGQSGDRGGSLGSGPHGGEWSGPTYSKPKTVTFQGPNVHGEGIGSQTFNKNLRTLALQNQYQQGAYQRAHPFLSKVRSGLGSLGRGIGQVARNFNPVSLAFDNPAMKLLASKYGQNDLRNLSQRNNQDDEEIDYNQLGLYTDRIGDAIGPGKRVGEDINVQETILPEDGPTDSLMDERTLMAGVDDMSTYQIKDFKGLDMRDKMEKSGIEIPDPLSDEEKQRLEELRNLRNSGMIGSTGTAVAAQGGMIGSVGGISRPKYQQGNMVGAEMEGAEIEGAEMEGAMMQSKEVIKELYDALIAQGLSPQEAMEKIKEIIAASGAEGPQSPMMGEELPGQEFSRVPAAFGGIMDTYTGRRKYGLGSFVKKIFKKVKKLASSKLGKLALMYTAGTYLGGTQALSGQAGGMGTFADRLKNPKLLANFLKPQQWGTAGSSPTNVADARGQWIQKGPPGQTGIGAQVFRENVPKVAQDSGILPGISNKVLAGVAGPSIAAGLYTAAQPPEELGGEVQGEYDDKKAWWDNYLANLDSDYSVNPDRLKSAQGGRIGADEGGLMNLGGMEKDYRNDGGFVPLGGEEKADDVPARLSRNEFVFTADAVRSAGGGDIDKGAEVMENVMKNLEGGGQISEESQGQGAQEMFETSERLSEVI